MQFGKPIGQFQLVQEKLAQMEVSRINVRNLLFHYIESLAAGRGISFAEASAMKLYSARAAVDVAMNAVQVLGGNGYMCAYPVEQLARDAKVLQIYAGTDENADHRYRQGVAPVPVSGPVRVGTCRGRGWRMVTTNGPWRTSRCS